MTPELTINGRRIAVDEPPLVVAEIGNNHDGNRSQALEMIAAAAEAGADAVKFQTYDPDLLVHSSHELYDFFVRYRLPRQWHEELKKTAERCGLLFFSSPFDEGSAAFLADLGVPAFKIASSELTNLPLIHTCAAFGKPVLLSTGMGSLAEAGAAIEACHIEENYQVAVMHCISEYPTPVDHSQINAVLELGRLFGIISGFSDHSLSPTLPAVAVAFGARIIEKHFTLSRDLKGPDHAVALEPDEFALMARACREAVAALSAPGKTITPELKKVRSASLRGLYAAVDIAAGTRLTKKHVVALRPPATLSIRDMHCVIGRTARVELKRGDAIKPEHLE